MPRLPSNFLLKEVQVLTGQVAYAGGSQAHSLPHSYSMAKLL